MGDMMTDIIFGERLVNTEYRERPSVYGVIIDQNANLAVIKVRDKDKYFLPGGGVEDGESYEDCLIREVREETGYQVKVKKQFATAEHYSYSEPLECYLKVKAHFYFADLGDKLGEKIEDDHELLWLPINEALSNMMLEHQEWGIKKAIALRSR